MESYKREFIQFLQGAGVLKFGDFTAKSGRKIPYFINAGDIKTGEQISKLGEFYKDYSVGTDKKVAKAMIKFYRDNVDSKYYPEVEDFATMDIDSYVENLFDVSVFSDPERLTSATAEQETAAEEVTVLGEGSRQFKFGVMDIEGKETWFEIHTDEEMVGAALLALKLIEGEEGPYGLYVKSVNGIVADYDKDNVYWAFYVNDDYGATGVDMTKIEEGTIYSFRIVKIFKKQNMFYTLSMV
mgnify:CR=1 FL=1